MQVEIYSKPNCPNCSASKQLLSMKNVPYTEHIVGETVTREALFERFPFVRSVPVIVIDDEYLGGLAELEKKLAG